MKSIKNHISLILALIGILFALQTIKITDRALASYTQKLKTNYALVVVSEKKLDPKKVLATNAIIEKCEPIVVDETIKKIDKNITKKNLELLKVTLPKFYKITLKHYPSPDEIEQLKKDIFRFGHIKQVEDFRQSYDTTYKLLVLFEIVVKLFSALLAIITLLLIAKELRIWQFNHKERMNIMGLFGAPRWLSSAVLFRLAIVDAIIASIITMLFFSYVGTTKWLLDKFEMIGINIEIFSFSGDFPILLTFALLISILLATVIVFWHKEEV